MNEREEEVPAFDGGVDEKPEGGSSLPMVIVISLVVLAAFSSVVWVAYNNGVIHSRANMQVADIETNEKPATPPGSGDLTPPQGQTKAFQQPAPSGEESAPPAAKMQAAQPATTPVAAQPPAPAKPAVVNVKPVAPAKQIAEPKGAAAQKPAAIKMTETVKQAPAVEKAAPPPPAPKTATVAKKTVSPASAPAPAKPTKVKVAAAATVAGGQYLLQIGAYKSQSDADAAWTALHKKHASLLAGLSPDIVQVDLGDKGTWYRLRAASFADRDAAAALCGKLKAAGGNCFVAK